MVQLLAFVITLSLPSFVLADSSTQLSSLAPELERILSRGELIVGMHKEDSPPFFMQNRDNTLSGLDVELAYEISRSLGVSISFLRDAETFDEVVDMVKEGRADIAISSLSQTPKRALFVSFTKPYVELHQALLLNRLKASRYQVDIGQEASRTEEENDFAGYEWLTTSHIDIGTIAGSSYIDFAHRDYPKAQVVPFDSFSDAAASLLVGRLDAVLYDDAFVKSWTTHNTQEILFVRPLVISNRRDPIAIAVHWNERQLLSWLNTELEALESNGTLKKLKAYYLESEDWRED